MVTHLTTMTGMVDWAQVESLMMKAKYLHLRIPWQSHPFSPGYTGDIEAVVVRYVFDNSYLYSYTGLKLFRLSPAIQEKQNLFSVFKDNLLIFKTSFIIHSFKCQWDADYVGRITKNFCDENVVVCSGLH